MWYCYPELYHACSSSTNRYTSCPYPVLKHNIKINRKNWNFVLKGQICNTDVSSKIALLKAVALFTPKRRRCKPTRIHCAWCVRVITAWPNRIHYTHCTQVIRTRTPNRMRRPSGRPTHADSVRGHRVVRGGYTHFTHSYTGGFLYSVGLFSEWIIRLPWARRPPKIAFSILFNAPVRAKF